MAKTTKSRPRSRAAKPKLLAGGNPQIPMADGDAPVQTYIAAMPGWKSKGGRRPVPPGGEAEETPWIDITKTISTKRS